MLVHHHPESSQRPFHPSHPPPAYSPHRADLSFLPSPKPNKHRQIPPPALSICTAWLSRRSAWPVAECCSFFSFFFVPSWQVERTPLTSAAKSQWQIFGARQDFGFLVLSHPTCLRTSTQSEEQYQSTSTTAATAATPIYYLPPLTHSLTHKRPRAPNHQTGAPSPDHHLPGPLPPHTNHQHPTIPILPNVHPHPHRRWYFSPSPSSSPPSPELTNPQTQQASPPPPS